MMKKCTKCNKLLPLDRFNKRSTKKNTFESRCKNCKKQYNFNHKEEIKQYNKKYNFNHKEEINKRSKKYNSNHKEEIKENNKQYRLDHKEEIKQNSEQYYFDHKEERKQYRLDHKEEIQEKKKRYRLNHKEEIKQYNKKYSSDSNNRKKRRQRNNKRARARYKNDPAYRIGILVSGMIYRMMKKQGASKNGASCWKYLPYTPEQFQRHIESKFEDWMTFENQGRYNDKTWDENDPSTKTWQIDHIIPQEDLPFSSMEEPNFQKLWALENIRPLSAKQNVEDGAKRTRHKTND
jgi:hypothetical protein